MTWRYYLQRALTDQWIDRDAELDNVEISWALSGPGELTAVVNANLARVIAVDNRKLFDEWSTIVYAEKDDQIRFGGILESSVDLENGQQQLNFISFSGYPTGRKYTGEYRLYEADAFDIIRYLWSWVQSDEYSNLNVIINSGLSGVTIGSEDPGPMPIRQEEESTEEFQGRLLSWQTSRNEPYELAWWNTPDVGESIDALITEANAEYVEDHQWATEDKDAVIHKIYLFRPNTEIKNVESPRVAPTLDLYWPTVQTLNPTSENTVPQPYIGLTSSATSSTEYVSTVMVEADDPINNYRYRVVTFSKIDGSVLRQSADISFAIRTTGGIVRYGSYYLAIVQGRALGNRWWIDIFDSQLKWVNSLPITVTDFPHTDGKPTIGYDHIGNQPMITWANATGTTVYHKMFTQLSGPIAGSPTYTHTGQTGIGSSRFTSAGRGNYDYSAERFFYTVPNSGVFVTNSAGGRLSTHDWTLPKKNYVTGVQWDSITSTFWSIDSTGLLTNFSNNNSSANSRSVHITYTWSDENAVGSLHETTRSPYSAITMQTRAYLRVTTPAPPEAWNVFSNDAAKFVKIYGRAATVTAFKHIETLDGSPWQTLITTSTYTGSEPPTRNTFDDLDLNAYTIGSRRQDLRFVEGENISTPPLPERNGEEYANFVIAIGAGSDRDTLREETARMDGRLRRDAVVPLKDTYSPSLLRITAQNYLDAVQNIMTFDTMNVFDHPNAQVGSWQLSDEIFIQTFSSYEQIQSWAKIVGWSLKPDQEDIATVTLIRIS